MTVDRRWETIDKLQMAGELGGLLSVVPVTGLLLAPSGDQVIAHSACDNNRAEIEKIVKTIHALHTVRLEHLALLTSGCARMQQLDCPNRPAVCQASAPDAWVGLWRQEGAPSQLRMTPTPGGNPAGQLTSDGTMGKKDTQLILGHLVGHTWVGTWKSSPGQYQDSFDAQGNAGRAGIRRGTFLLTLVSTTRIAGAQQEGQDSFINQGMVWQQTFNRCPEDDCHKIKTQK